MSLELDNLIKVFDTVQNNIFLLSYCEELSGLVEIERPQFGSLRLVVESLNGPDLVPQVPNLNQVLLTGSGTEVVPIFRKRE